MDLNFSLDREQNMKYEFKLFNGRILARTNVDELFRDTVCLMRNVETEYLYRRHNEMLKRVR